MSSSRPLLSSWDIEARVAGVIARLAGISASIVKPDLRLECLGCGVGTTHDLVDVLERELGLPVWMRSAMNLGGDPPPKVPQPSPETVWDLVKLFHRARVVGPFLRPHDRAGA